VPRLAVSLLLPLLACTSPWSNEAGAEPTPGRHESGSPPGAEERTAELVKRLEAALAGRGSDYEPRTRHRLPDGTAKFMNRLILESSPYLLQHAHNPVDWYSWGGEAFAAARRRGVPVLLSVGYSTCHWCHVMEEESFEDEEIATYLNEHYVAIKVDREERPDVDSIYMAAVQAMTGRGGWPMTVWLLHDRTPMFGGTYFPARDGDRGTSTGFLTLLMRMHEIFTTEPERAVESAARISQNIRARLEGGVGAGDLPGPAVIEAAMKSLESQFDSTWGGRRGAPKFPSSMPVRLLLRVHRRTGRDRALEMAYTTLSKMAAGGMYDQVGGGFHRYSTDARWLVPHFEKMLYDNALLTMAYLEAYQVMGDDELARVAADVLRYVMRDMTSPAGAFYSATDADSLNPAGHREEGWFFTWTPAELEEVLGAKDAAVVGAYWRVTAEGNFEGRNILHVPRPLATVARELEIEPTELRQTIERARDELYEQRKSRPAPIRDEKILAAWNGLMISAMARGALVLGDERYAAAAARSAEFVLGKMRVNGRLRRSYKDGAARHNGYLDDYAFVTAGLLDLFEATGERRWLGEAIALDRVLHARYEDDAGGFFLTSDDHEVLLARERPSYDGAEPSGSSVAILNLLRLAEFTTRGEYRARAERALKKLHGVLSSSPTSVSELLLAVDYYLDAPKEVVIVTAGGRAEAAPLLAELQATFLPNRILAVVSEGSDQEKLAELVPLVEKKVAQGDKATAYVCVGRVCDRPTSDPEVFARQIREVRPLRSRPSGAPAVP